MTSSDGPPPPEDLFLRRVLAIINVWFETEWEAACWFR